MSKRRSLHLVKIQKVRHNRGDVSNRAPMTTPSKKTRRNFLAVASERNIGTTAMKVPAYGRLFKPGVLDGMNQALGYALSQPGVHCAVIAAKTIEQLEENVRAAEAFQTLDATALAAIEEKTAVAWQDNTFFRAWT